MLCFLNSDLVFRSRFIGPFQLFSGLFAERAEAVFQLLQEKVDSLAGSCARNRLIRVGSFLIF